MKAKIINALFLITIFIGSLFLNKLLFSIALSMLALLSLRELFLIKEKHIPIEMELVSYIITLFLVMNNYYNRLDYYLVDYKILTILLLTSLIPLVIINNKNKYSILDALYLIGSTLFIGITFNLILQFRIYNMSYVSYIILIALITSIFEYVTTYFIGKTAIVPSISPKKTLEGIIGGVVMSTIISTMFFISTITTELPLYAIVIITFILSVFGEFGDLVFSFIKKEFNKSNFSNNNSKFSGILDIIDSVVFITLAFILFVTFL